MMRNQRPLTQHPAAPFAETEIENIEILLLLQAIYKRWGYDFRDYAPASFKRRIQRILGIEKVATVSALQERLLRDVSLMQRFINQVTVSVTSMYRDPTFYKAFRNIAIPLLKLRPALRIWIAGCASGEEVYSLAILLREEGLFDRASIYVTDINQAALDTARNGIYPLEKMQEYTGNYQAAGGKAEFSEYYQAGHGSVVMRADLSKNIIWAQHNLVIDASFNEFDLLLCRNVLIYFNTRLQARVHHLIYDSLVNDGVLVLGRNESLQLTPHESCFQALDSYEKIYRRVR
ncbi:MAG TPA: protein-glutamate O-methyltransferase CheR [Acidobacteriaceae bacterium]|nr:protein-glutamate O-methyltransferase CheR [Acidobacteriaceae bacterium]